MSFVPSKSQSTHLVAAQALGGHRVVVAAGAGGCDYADATNPLHFGRVVGITAGASSAGQSVRVQQSGRMTFSGWNWTPDADIFLGSNGLLTQTNPSSGVAQVVGFSTSPTEVWVEISPPIKL